MPRGVNQYDAAQIERRLWSPELILPDCWYDASDYSTLVWDARITKWKDKGYKGNDLNQVSVSDQPDWKLNIYNDTKPAIEFDGLNDTLALTTAITWTSLHSVVWVGEINETPGNGSGLFYSSTNNLDSCNNYTGGIFWYYAPAGGDIVQSNGTYFTINTPYITSIARDSTTWNIFQNGEAKTIASSSSGNGAFLGFGKGYNSYSQMTVAECVFYPNRRLWELSKIEGYMAAKWNMNAALDVNHQYKNKVPLRDAG